MSVAPLTHPGCGDAVGVLPTLLLAGVATDAGLLLLDSPPAAVGNLRAAIGEGLGTTLTFAPWPVDGNFIPASCRNTRTDDC